VAARTQFSKVCFSYESLITKARPALDHVSFTIHKGALTPFSPTNIFIYF
jgi:hypothetical protein